MRIRFLVLSTLAVGVAACGGYGGGPTEQSPGGGNSSGGVSITNNAFTPSTLNVSAGTAVTWTWNSGGTVHNVHFDDGQFSSDQGSGTYSRTFAQNGAFPYHCTIHGVAMSGVVNVTGGSTGGGGGGTGGGGGSPGY
jgi:plastocyanin